MARPSIAKTISKTEVFAIIEAARNAEACRDMDAVPQILKPLWPNIDKTPDFSNYEPSVQAELLRLAGFALAFRGFAKGKPDGAERGRDLLTQALILLEKEGSPDQYTIVQIFLALCYWYEGAAGECETILSDVEARYKGNKESETYFLIRYYRMITYSMKREFEKASEVVAELKSLISNCSNKRLLSMFYTEAGVDCRRRGDYDEAKRHYTQAMEYAQEMSIMGLVSANLNNLAFLHKETGHFETAHRYIDKAIAINKLNKQKGFLAHKYDTKALIYFDTRDYESALAYISKAIELFEEGEDNLGHADALFTKAEILLRLGRADEGLRVFGRQIEFARVKLGEKSAIRYSREFAKLIHAKRGLGYREELRVFKKEMMKEAFRQADLAFTETREILSLTQSELSAILNYEFPDLCDELGIKRSGVRRKIEPIRVENPELEGYSAEKLATFRVYGEKLPQLGSRSDVVVAVHRNTKARLSEGRYFLVQCLTRNLLECGLIKKEESLGLYFFENDGNPCPFTANEVKIIGEIVGYCPIESLDDVRTVFRSMDDN